MLKALLIGFICATWSLSAFADQPLVTALALDSAQARDVTAIQAEVRKNFAPLRQEHNRVMRAARRAKLAYDDAEQTRLETEAADLVAQMRALWDDEEARIRALLNAQQLPSYDAWLAQRDAMHGSSRDAALLRGR